MNSIHNVPGRQKETVNRHAGISNRSLQSLLKVHSPHSREFINLRLSHRFRFSVPSIASHQRH